MSQSILAGWLKRTPSIEVTDTGSATPQPFTFDLIGASTSPLIAGSPQTAPCIDSAAFFCFFVFGVGATEANANNSTGARTWPRHHRFNHHLWQGCRRESELAFGLAGISPCATGSTHRGDIGAQPGERRGFGRFGQSPCTHDRQNQRKANPAPHGSARLGGIDATPEIGGGGSCPASIMPRRMARVRVK